MVEPVSAKRGKPIRSSDVDVALDQAEENLRTCWSYLIDFRKQNFSKDRPDPILEFQPLLADSLYRLSRLHSKFAKEKLRCIARKTRHDPNWFRRRMAFLDRQQRRLDEAIRVGRAIGNSFAWFFYQKERERLHLHLQEPRPSTMSAGVGGIGEWQAAKNIKKMGKWFVLHHCVTDILRIGDVSLVDLKTLRVSGLGEIKSHQDTPGVVNISITVIGEKPGPEITQPRPQAPEEGKRQPPADVLKTLSVSANDRLERQLMRIQESHREARKAPDSKLSLHSEGRMKEVEALLKATRSSRVSYSRVGPGQTAFSYRYKKLPWSKQFSGRAKSRKLPTNLSNSLKAIPNHVLQTMLPHRKDNALFIGSFFYDEEGQFSYLTGMTHPFWWPIDPEVLEEIVFKKVLLVTTYNPAWLYEALEKAGFVVDASDTHNPRVTRANGDSTFNVEGFPFYYRAIQESFMEEDAIVAGLVKTAETIGAHPPDAPTRITLRLYQKFGNPEDD